MVLGEAVCRVRSRRRAVVIDHRVPGRLEKLHEYFRLGSARQECQMSVSGPQDDRVEREVMRCREHLPEVPGSAEIAFRLPYQGS
jgi:hypothetical protein